MRSRDTVRKIQQVLNYVRAVPSRLEMVTFGDKGTPGTYTYLNRAKVYPDCGTVACFAGWLVYLNDGKSKFNKFLEEGDGMCERASELLGIPLHKTEKVFTDNRAVYSVTFKGQYNGLIAALNRLMKKSCIKHEFAKLA